LCFAAEGRRPRGITANPALGYASDRLVAEGGTVILAEVPELVGAEHLLAPRVEPPVAATLFEMIERVEARARMMHVEMRYVSAYACEFGLSSIGATNATVRASSYRDTCHAYGGDCAGRPCLPFPTASIHGMR
jgi:hypothetical protein